MKTPALSLILLFSRFASSQSEPIKFRGAYIGEALADFVDCSRHQQKSLKEGYKVSGKVCEGKPGAVGRVKFSSFLTMREEGENFLFRDKILYRIVIWVSNDDWEKVKYDLTQKLGEPVTQMPDVYQNGFGARWEFSQGMWIKDDLVAVAGMQVDTTPVFSNHPVSKGIQISITDKTHAKLPSTRLNSLD
jgi:hypothetical protein